MNMIEIIQKKQQSQELTKEEIEFFIQGYTKDLIPDYQASALIMAMYLKGLSDRETTDLTLAMANSGEVLDLSSISNIVVDKHSTGGVGDKVTILLMPIIASLGIPVAKMSGRGLGFTGGTVDKLESIPGYRTDLSIEQMTDNVKKIGISLIGQTSNLAPADKKIYALRDATGCVDNMSLIASSIMSKKIASGANKLVLDVTVGSGAFMKTIEQARQLANTMKKIGELANKETICVLSSMEEPLGKCIGNTLEIMEVAECLEGNMQPDVKEVVTTIGAYIIKLAKKGDDIEENKKKILEQIENKNAYRKFLELVYEQGGDTSYIDNIYKFKKAKYIIEVKSPKTGYVKKADARKLGELSVKLGAGRMKKEDTIDHSAGIMLKNKIGDKVEEGETLGYIHTNKEDIINQAKNDFLNAYEICEEKVDKTKTIIEII